MSTIDLLIINTYHFMKKLLLGILVCSCSLGCADSDNAIDRVNEGLERGAILRTLEINQGEFYVNEPTSTFDIILEEMDKEDGELLSSVNVYLSFIDNTADGNSVSIPSSLFKTYVAADFTTGAFNLPNLNLQYTYNELLEAVGLTIGETNCKDQFRLDLELTLTDGRVFKNENSSNGVIHTISFSRSPFSYLINIVEPISEDVYIGNYQLEHIEDGNFGPTFLTDQQVTIMRGHSTNVRIFEIKHSLNRTEDDLFIEFTIACDKSIVTRYMPALPACRTIGGVPVLVETFPPEGILIGPDSEMGIISDVDDSVFELWYVEAFEGRDEGCGFSDFPAKIRLTNQ